MSAETPNLMSVAQLAEHYGRAKKTIQNKLTRGWGPCRYWTRTRDQVLGFRVEEVNRFDQRNQRTHKQYLYD